MRQPPGDRRATVRVGPLTSKGSGRSCGRDRRVLAATSSLTLRGDLSACVSHVRAIGPRLCIRGNARGANSLNIDAPAFTASTPGLARDSDSGTTEGKSWTSPIRSDSSDSPTTTSCSCPATPTSSRVRRTPPPGSPAASGSRPRCSRRDGHRHRVPHGHRDGPPGRPRRPAPQPLDRRPGDQVDKVKRSESGMISNPVTTTPDATVAEVDALCGQFRVSRPPGRRRRRQARRHHHQPRHALRLRRSRRPPRSCATS